MVPAQRIPVLEPFYYLDNFERVLTSLVHRYADLLSIAEHGFIDRFLRMPQASRALLVRMVMRRGPLFLAAKLDYAEIGGTHAAAQPLIEAGWIDDRPKLAAAELARLLTKADLIRCIGLSSHCVKTKKSELASLLAERCQESREFAAWCPSMPETLVYSLVVAPLCERFRLMFFGNHRQSWPAFITAQLGILRYEPIDPSLQSRPFQTRAQIDALERIQQCRQSMRGGMPAQDVVPLVPERVEGAEWLEEIRQELVFTIARELERGGACDAALTQYLPCTHRGARTRAMRIYARARDWQAVGTLCTQALGQPRSEAEYQQARRASRRLRRETGLEWHPAPAPIAIPEFELTLERAPQSQSVELHVRDHLARETGDGRTVRFVENWLINSLFGLLCWHAIFAPVAGAFFHAFHRAPADLASTGFYTRRREHFARCLALLEAGGYQQQIARTYAEKQGIEAPFVNWYSLDAEVLDWALACFPPAHLRSWFEWILRDVQENRCGFPDLVQFWPNERRYRLIEVKGPGDRVQDNQRRLLEYCAARRMPIAVCYARWDTAG